MTDNLGVNGGEEVPGVTRGYTRVSTDDQAKSGISLKVQEKQIEAFYDYKLKPLGYRWGGVFRDEAVSGFKLPFLRRPAASELHSLLRRGDFVVIPKVDRLSRRIRDIDKTISLWRDMGVGFRFLDMDIDFDAPWGKFVLHVISAFAEMEAEMIRERNRMVAAWRKYHNMPIGRPGAPIGYRWQGEVGRKVLLPAGKDREIIDRIMEWRIAGSEFDDIAVHFQKMGMTRHDGSELTAKRVRRIFYKELDHLLKKGVLLRAGGGKGYPLHLKWQLDKLDANRLKRLQELYQSLGRTINDQVQPQQ